MANRIYVVKNSTGEERLIEATSQAQALSFVVKDTLTVELASQTELVRLVTEGIVVEPAGE
jgi:hypothetical protein